MDRPINNKILLYDIINKTRKRQFEYMINPNETMSLKDITLGIKGSLDTLDVLTKEFEIPLEEEEKQDLKI